MYQTFQLSIDYEDRNTTFDRIYHILTKRGIEIENIVLNRIETFQFKVIFLIHLNAPQTATIVKLVQKIPDVQHVEISEKKSLID